MPFQYKCPDCQSDYAFHESGCQFAEYDMWEVERAYVDIISRLVGREEPWEYENLRDAIDTIEDEDSGTPAFSSTGGTDTRVDHPGWTDLHQHCLNHLKNIGRAAEGPDGIDISEPGQRQEGVIPKNDPIRTVFEYGPIDGCKDYSVVSMVSWCTLVELDWEQTQAFIVYWLQETGRWESESWGESSPKELVKSKQHIHERELGWGEYPQLAKTEMETSSKERQLDAESVAAMVDRELLSSMSV